MAKGIARKHIQRDFFRAFRAYVRELKASGNLSEKVNIKSSSRPSSAASSRYGIKVKKLSPVNKKNNDSYNDNDRLDLQKALQDTDRMARIADFLKEDPLMEGYILPNWVPKDFTNMYFGPDKNKRDWLNCVAHSNRKMGDLESLNWPLFCRAFAYAHLEKFDSAKYDMRKLFEKMQVDHHHESSVLYLRSVLYIKMGKIAKSLSDLNAVLEDKTLMTNEPNIYKAALKNKIILERRCGLYVKSNRAYIRLKNANDDIKKAKRKAKKSNREKILPLIASHDVNNNNVPKEQLNQLTPISFDTLHNILNDEKHHLHDNNHGQKNTLSVLELHRDSQNMDMYNKFKKEKRKTLLTGVVKKEGVYEGKVVDDTTVLESLVEDKQKSPKNASSRLNKMTALEELTKIAHRTLPTHVDKALRVDPEIRTNQQYKDAKYVTHTLSCFAKYPDSVKEAMSRVMTLRDLRRDEVICRQGDQPDDYFICVGGKLGVRIRDPKDPEATILVNHMGAGTAFGELGLIFRQKRSATVFAEEPSSVLQIHGEDFRAIGIANFHLKHLQEKYDAFIRTGLFDAWTDENLTKLATVAQKKKYPTGTIIIQQGQVSEFFYVIQKGVIEVQAYPNEADEIKKQELMVQEKLERVKEKKSLHRYMELNKMETVYQNEIKTNEDMLEQFRDQRKLYLAEYGSIDVKQLAVKTTTLIKPSVFGENSILNPDKREPASVIAGSHVEVLAVAKSQIAAAWITQKFLKRLRSFTNAPPPAETLHKMYAFDQFWKKTREESTAEIRTTKHPKPVNKFGREWY